MAKRMDYYWKDANGNVAVTSTMNEKHKAKFDKVIAGYTGVKATCGGEQICVFAKRPLDELFETETEE